MTNGGRLVVFDLDGTLVDSVPDLAASLAGVLERRGLPAPDRSTVAAMVGDGAAVLVDRAFAALGRDPDTEALPEFLAAIDGPPRHARLFDGAIDTMARLAAEGWRLAVCTNKPQRATLSLLAGLGVSDRFAAVLGGDATPARKPDPAHLRAVIEASGADARDTVMVGDHANDIAAARGCGVPAIFAGWGYGPLSMAEGAWRVAASMQQIPTLAEECLRRPALDTSA